MIIVVMGVSGSGKTTIGRLLAARMGVTFADGDDYHSAANKAKMAAGLPLNDDDRQPWLTLLNGVMRDWQKSGTGGVLACSALKEAYRENLMSGMPAGGVDFVLLNPPEDVLVERLAHRHHAFMDPHLLTSQLKTLELPKEALIITNDRTPEEEAGDILQQLERAPAKI